MKQINFITLIMLFSFFANAKNVPINIAKNVAKNYYIEHSNFTKNTLLLSDAIIEKADKQNVFYVFNLKNDNGFIIVSAEDTYYPIIGYSLTSKYIKENQPDYIKSFYSNYKEQILFLRKNKIQSSQKISNLWNKYSISVDSYVKQKNDIKTVDPLTGDITWNQTQGWDQYCPPGTPTGCVATAMSIIMKYYEYPVHGIGSFSYTDDGITHSANFANDTYFWNLMPKNTGSQFSAMLSYHVGISVQMDYGPEGSGTYSYLVKGALTNHFNYDADSHVYKGSYSENVWKNKLKTDLDNDQPIYYSGRSSEGGHAFVCDGYDASDNFHFNFGWGGANNGFFSLSDVGGYSSDQGATLDIKPADTSTQNPPQNTQAILNPIDDNNYNVSLTWEAPATKAVATYKIYRDFNQIAEVTSSTLSFTDANPPQGNFYYSISAKYTNTKESLASSDFMKAAFNVVFHAKDPNTNSEVYTANVSFNNTELPTTFVGASFPDVPYGMKEYTITHDDYPTTSGFVSVTENVSLDVLLDGSTSGVKLVDDSKYSVYPNPANDVLTIYNTNNKNNTLYEIYDVNGKQIMFGKLSEEYSKINIKELVNGFYILKIINSNSIETKSIIKN